MLLLGKDLEKQRRLEEEKLNNIENNRLKQEEYKLVEWNKIFHDRFKSMLKKVKQKESWDFLNRCDGKPKIKSEKDLNAFIYHVQENILIEHYPDWNEFIQKINFMLDVTIQFRLYFFIRIIIINFVFINYL